MLDRFWSKVERTKSCWNWKAATYRDGYGIFGLDGGVVRAHRLAYELLVGEIPIDKELHHICKNKLCVNPYHLEAITHREHQRKFNGLISNQLLRIHCPHGHEYNEKNTYVSKKGSRYCRICRNKYSAISHKKGVIA